RPRDANGRHADAHLQLGARDIVSGASRPRLAPWSRGHSRTFVVERQATSHPQGLGRGSVGDLAAILPLSQRDTLLDLTGAYHTAAPRNTVHKRVQRGVEDERGQPLYDGVRAAQVELALAHRQFGAAPELLATAQRLAQHFRRLADIRLDQTLAGNVRAVRIERVAHERLHVRGRPTAAHT